MIVSNEALNIKGEVKIDGNLKVKLDSDSNIKIESVEKTVNVRFEKCESRPETEIFNDGKKYSISLSGKPTRICELDQINGTWINCEIKGNEVEIAGWVNAAQTILVTEL